MASNFSDYLSQFRVSAGLVPSQRLQESEKAIEQEARSIEKRVADAFERNTSWQKFEYQIPGKMLHPKTWEHPEEYADSHDDAMTFSMYYPSVRPSAKGGFNLMLAFCAPATKDAVIRGVSAESVVNSPAASMSEGLDSKIQAEQQRIVKGLFDNFEFEAFIDKAVSKYDTSWVALDYVKKSYSSTKPMVVGHIIFNLKPV